MEGYFYWTPKAWGDGPDLKTEERVEALYCNFPEDGWGKDPRPVWRPCCTYRFPAEDLRGPNGGPSVEDAFEVPQQRTAMDLVDNIFDGPDIEEYEAPEEPSGSLPDDPKLRNAFPMFDGLLAYFPNALAMVSKLSFDATQQHHPDQEMHWDRGKSTNHENKIIRHLIDSDTVDDKGNDHWAMVCWRALAGYQTYLEKKHGYPMSRASRNAEGDKAP